MEDSDQTPAIDIDIDYDIEVKKELLDEEVQHSLFMKKLLGEHEDVKPSSSFQPEIDENFRSSRRGSGRKNKGGVKLFEEELDENEDLLFHISWTYDSSTSSVLLKSADNQSRLSNHGAVDVECTDGSMNQCSKVDLESTKTGNQSPGSGPLVATSSKSIEGKRIYDKKFCCIYCKQLVTKPSRHLEAKHEDEEDVQAFLKMKRGSKERKFLIEKIRKKGEFFHIQEMISKNDGKIQPIRRRNSKSSVNEYLPCEFCLGYYFHKRLPEHQKHCHFRKADTSIDRQEVIRKAKTLVPIPDKAKDVLFTHVLRRMVNDEIKGTIIEDSTIMKYGEIMCMKLIHLPSSKNFIAQKLREIAEVLMIARNLSPNITHLKSCFSPDTLDVAVKAMKQVSRFDNISNTFGNPRICKKIGYAFQSCCRIVRREAIINGDADLQKKVDSFLELYLMQWKNNFVQATSNVGESDDLIESPEDDGSSTFEDRSSPFEDANECSNDESQYEEPKPRVAVSKKSVDGKRLYDKKSFCIYCKKFVTKLSKHLEAIHESEKDVKEFLKLSKGSKDRAMLIGKIRKKGHFYHNQEIILKEEGELQPARRLNPVSPMGDYIPCQYCLGFYLARRLAVHQKSCFFRKPEDNKAVVLKGNPLLAVPANISNKFRRNLSRSLSDGDTLKETILNDSIIMKYGEIMCRKRIISPLNKYQIHKLRDVARFFLIARELSPNISDFKSCFSPDAFELVVQATRGFAKYDADTNTYESPSLCKKVGVILEKCCKIVIRDALIDDDDELGKKAESFLELYNMHWNENFSQCIKSEGKHRGSPIPIYDSSTIENTIQYSYDGNQEQFLKDQIKVIDSSMELYSNMHWENCGFVQRTPDEENSNNKIQPSAILNDSAIFKNKIHTCSVENHNKVNGPSVATTRSNNGKRVYDKRFCCIYCKRMVSKISKHLEGEHKKEEEVKAFLKLEKGSKERLLLIEKIRKKGEFFHNLEAMSKTNGKIQPCRRNKTETSVSDYIPCKYCLGYYLDRRLALHQRKCHFRYSNC